MLKVTNTIVEFENSSRRYVPGDSYYIIHLKVINGVISNSTNVIKNFFGNLDDPPLVIYLSPFDDEIWLLFSSVVSEDHLFKGCHQELCSYFSSRLTREIPGNEIVKCWIVELNSRTKIIEYFHTLIFSMMIKRVGDKHLTLDDAIDAFSREKWESFSPKERYGVLTKQRGQTLSEEIDYRHLQKYMAFFFDA
jgi:hypothetical protein